MNPFLDLDDTELVALSAQWLMQRPENEHDVPGWQQDLDALRAERDRRRGE